MAKTHILRVNSLFDFCTQIEAEYSLASGYSGKTEAIIYLDSTSKTFYKGRPESRKERKLHIIIASCILPSGLEVHWRKSFTRMDLPHFTSNESASETLDQIQWDVQTFILIKLIISDSPSNFIQGILDSALADLNYDSPTNPPTVEELEKIQDFVNKFEDTDHEDYETTFEIDTDKIDDAHLEYLNKLKESNRKNTNHADNNDDKDDHNFATY